MYLWFHKSDEMVKLQKRFAYKYKNKNHYKHIVTIPNVIIETLGWKDGTEIEQRVENDSLVFRLTKHNLRAVNYES